jgi:hypothetical protein
VAQVGNGNIFNRRGFQDAFHLSPLLLRFFDSRGAGFLEKPVLQQVCLGGFEPSVIERLEHDKGIKIIGYAKKDYLRTVLDKPEPFEKDGDLVFIVMGLEDIQNVLLS